jgi:hypothetical protein
MNSVESQPFCLNQNFCLLGVRLGHECSLIVPADKRRVFIHLKLLLTSFAHLVFRGASAVFSAQSANKFTVLNVREWSSFLSTGLTQGVSKTSRSAFTHFMPSRSRFLQLFHHRGRVLALVLIHLLTHLHTTSAQIGDQPPKDHLHQLHTCDEGPWGRLRYYYFFLEAPEYVVAQFPLPNTTSKWIFPLNDFDRIEPMLRSAGLEAESVERLLLPRRVVKDDRYVYLFPSAFDLESMSSETRSLIYAELARNPANTYHYSPVFFLADSVAEWAQESGLSQDIVDRISSLSYKAGNALVFSDIPLLLSHAENVTEARFLMQKLTRVRTLMVQLELSESDSIPDLLNYWSTGLGLRRKEIEPLLHAIAKTEGVDHVSLLHLLPPQPRKLLYTYPDMSYATEGRLPDCHWTSLNFFNLRPQQYLLDTRLATSLVQQDFEKVEPPYRYGDILMFIEPNKGAVHSATYLAGDILFSKNGSNLLAPWLLMRLQDLKNLYNVSPGNTRIQGYRHK